MKSRGVCAVRESLLSQNTDSLQPMQMEQKWVNESTVVNLPYNLYACEVRVKCLCLGVKL